MGCFTQYLDPTPREEVVIPPSVQNYIYRSNNTNLTHARSKRRTPRTRTSVNTKRRAARGVVFDTTLSPQSNSAKSDIGAREKIEMAAPHEITISNTIYTKVDKEGSTQGTKTVELAAKRINTIPRTKEYRVSLNQVTNHESAVEDKLQTEEVSFLQDVSHKKKRKLPQTLLSTLKRKPEVSVLGFLNKHGEGKPSALHRTSNSKAEDKALDGARRKENADERESEKEKSRDQCEVIEISSDSEGEKDSNVDETNENTKNRSTTSDIVEDTENVNDVNDESDATNCVDDSINTDNEERCTTHSMEEETEPQENKSKWNNESGLSTGLSENQSDEEDECPFCSSDSEKEGELSRSKNKSDIDVLDSFAEHDVSEIDLIDDLLEEEASYLEVTL